MACSFRTPIGEGGAHLAEHFGADTGHAIDSDGPFTAVQFDADLRLLEPGGAAKRDFADSAGGVIEQQAAPRQRVAVRLHLRYRAKSGGCEVDGVRAEVQQAAAFQPPAEGERPGQQAAGDERRAPPSASNARHVRRTRRTGSLNR